MKPVTLVNVEFRRVGHDTEAISVQIQSASVDATSRTKRGTELYH
jgi:hypothetical protein